ncbi:hypothetical protein ACFU93_32105 [Streptomyces sp. NPDC057611]|uniref:hypothetical protein n=1 Tax=Streptomyces sp. NPDC057611 TaxID=3346182 RepID=UPI0036C4B072
MAREITRRLYPLHTEAAKPASQLATWQQAEASARRAVAEAVAGTLHGTRIDEEHRCTRIVWQHTSHPPGQSGPAQVDSVCAAVGTSKE